MNKMRSGLSKYFDNERSTLYTLLKVFVVLIFVFALVFFLWSLMKYNKLLDEKEDKEKYISELRENIDELEYLVDMPLDDEYKIRVARERLGMCFPDEMIFYTDVE